MGISKKMADALVVQFNEEIKSAYLYEAAAADFAAKNLQGFSSWMTKQAEEERQHAEKIHRYLNDKNERVYYRALDEPQNEWETPLSIIKASLKHEEFITECIHNLLRLARQEDDIATEIFLEWYVIEQVEEEATVQSIIDKFAMLGDGKIGLYTLDKEIKTRVN